MMRRRGARCCRWTTGLATTLVPVVVVVVTGLIVAGGASPSPPDESAATAAELRQLARSAVVELIGRHPAGHSDADVRREVSQLLTEYYDQAGGKDDVLFDIGSTFYGWEEPAHPDSAETEEEPTVIVDFDYMKQFIKDVFLSYGVPADRAETCADVLIESDKRGIDSHGLGRLKPIYCDRMDSGILHPSQPIDVVKETETTALLDGNLGLGLYIGPHAMQLAIDKAKEHGVGFVAVRNSTHYGIAGYYATMAADRGCVGFTGTNARPSIAATFGAEPMLGTNPLTFAVPSSDDFPFCIDCATSINQRGKIERYAREGKKTPRGCVVDINGIERTDTKGILKDMVLGKCFLTPVGGAGDKLGGYKGYGWATTVELLCTAFQSGPFGDAICGVDRATGKPKPMPLGHFFLAIDVEALCPLDTFKENVGKLLRAIRESRKSPTGPGRIWTAGEPESKYITMHRFLHELLSTTSFLLPTFFSSLTDDKRIQRYAQGGMPVPLPLQKNMIILRDNRPGLKEKYAKLPFE
jgi:LDH2 family malate/lactate/ureidoglycolate dehydrogenase